MCQTQDILPAPVYIIGDKRRLFIDFIRRIHIYGPASIKFTGTVISSPQWGQTVR